MSLQTRLAALITAIGADIKDIRATKTILDGLTSLSDTEQPNNAVEWRDGGSGEALLAKLVEINPIVASVIANRSEVWLRVKSRDGVSSQDRLLLDSDGRSGLVPPRVTVLPTTGPSGGALVDGQECYFVANNARGIVWHLRYNATVGKWEFLGGGAYLVEGGSGASVDYSGVAYAAATGSQPSIAAPLPGDYTVRLGNENYHTAIGGWIYSGVSVNGSSPTDGVDTVVNANPGGEANSQFNTARTTQKTITTAGHVIDMRYKASGATGKIRRPWLEITPVLLG